MTEIKLNKDRLEILKELSSHSIRTDINTVREYEEYNYITGKKNTIKDIKDAYVKNDFKDKPEVKEKLDHLVDTMVQSKLENIKKINSQTNEMDLER